MAVNLFVHVAQAIEGNAEWFALLLAAKWTLSLLKKHLPVDGLFKNSHDARFMVKPDSNGSEKTFLSLCLSVVVVSSKKLQMTVRFA